MRLSENCDAALADVKSVIDNPDVWGYERILHEAKKGYCAALRNEVSSFDEYDANRCRWLREGGNPYGLHLDAWGQLWAEVPVSRNTNYVDGDDEYDTEDVFIISTRPIKSVFA